ncbi:MAG: hypothetical protein WCT33_03675 [Patescibacteria group bacterium]|jgi:hypothetical protein
MTFPLYVFLIIYAVVFLIYVFFSAFLFYHIFRFGYWDSSTKFMVFLYFLVTIGILLSTIIYTIDIDWSETITLFSDTQFNFSFY